MAWPPQSATGMRTPGNVVAADADPEGDSTRAALKAAVEQRNAAARRRLAEVMGSIGRFFLEVRGMDPRIE